jgi:hypothetical protein
MFVRHKYLHKKSKWPLTSVLFWDFMLRLLVVFTDVSEQFMGPSSRVKQSKKKPPFSCF